MAWNPLVPGSSVCICLKIDHNQCRDLVLAGKVTCFDQLKQETGAGTRCTLCVPYFEAIIALYRDQASTREA